MTECVACLEPATRKRFRGLPVCRNCDPGRVPKAELDRYEADLRKRAARKAELSPAARLGYWPWETCPVPVPPSGGIFERAPGSLSRGLPYAVLGPPRRVGSWDAWDEEIARQERLSEAGLLRRGYYLDGKSTRGPVTLGWQQYQDGRFAWHGYDSWGIALYSGVSTGQVGGSWPSPDDYLRAWEAGQDAALKDMMDYLDPDFDAMLRKTL